MGSGRAGPSSAVSIGAPSLRDQELLAWTGELIEQVLGGISPAAKDGAPKDGAAPDGAEG
jgi:hypothetical protein